MGELSAALNRAGQSVTASPVTPASLADLITRLKDGTLSSKTAKLVFEGLWVGEGSVDEIIAARGLEQVSDTGALTAIIEGIVAANPGQVDQFRAGKDKVFGFFVGQVMKATQGKANPQQVSELLQEALKKP
jgi:aspartyl-tRNA(Asn)/glutamyl-tRNA(Gln) amidotransferase subunit B